MESNPKQEQEFRQDALECLNNLLNVLQERIFALLAKNDPGSMKPAEREQAASRYLMLMPRLLQLRQQYAQATSTERAQAEYEEILQALRSPSEPTEEFKPW